MVVASMLFIAVVVAVLALATARLGLAFTLTIAGQAARPRAGGRA
jgi:hypothetical protein